MKPFWIIAGLLLTAGTQSVWADSPQEDRRERAAERVERALENDSVLRPFGLDADSKGDRTGYIELKGKVRNQNQLRRAARIARQLAPQYRIVNTILVKR